MYKLKDSTQKADNLKSYPLTNYIRRWLDVYRLWLYRFGRRHRIPNSWRGYRGKPKQLTKKGQSWKTHKSPKQLLLVKLQTLRFYIIKFMMIIQSKSFQQKEATINVWWDGVSTHIASKAKLNWDCKRGYKTSTLKT